MSALTELKAVAKELEEGIDAAGKEFGEEGLPVVLMVLTTMLADIRHRLNKLEGKP